MFFSASLTLPLLSEMDTDGAILCAAFASPCQATRGPLHSGVWTDALTSYSWTMSKLAPKRSQSRETLQFLLDHPRRCFIYLFPSQ